MNLYNQTDDGPAHYRVFKFVFLCVYWCCNVNQSFTSGSSPRCPHCGEVFDLE